MVKIANPLYDYAFKYLMSNDKLAKKVLSTILDREILELELSQQEIVVHDETKHFTMYRLDFKALIRDATGKEERVMIDVVDYLQTSLLDKATLEKLIAEQEVEDIFAGQESDIAFFKQQSEEAKAREEEAKAREQKMQNISIKALYQTGMDTAQIAVPLGLDIGIVKSVLKE